MLIACKYEEIYAPEVRDFVYITDKAYTREEILQMEFHMLSTLDFSISSPSSYRFLERFGKIASANSKQICLARYLIELPLIEYRMLKHCPSNQAASALYLAMKILPRYHPHHHKEEVKGGETQEFENDENTNVANIQQIHSPQMKHVVPAWNDLLAQHTGYSEL